MDDGCCGDDLVVECIAELLNLVGELPISPSGLRLGVDTGDDFIVDCTPPTSYVHILEVVWCGWLICDTEDRCELSCCIVMILSSRASSFNEPGSILFDALLLKYFDRVETRRQHVFLVSCCLLGDGIGVVLTLLCLRVFAVAFFLDEPCGVVALLLK